MTYRWRALKPGLFARNAGEPGADPMWVWADATGYRDLGPAARVKNPQLWCVVERQGRCVSELHEFDDNADLRTAELAMPVVPERMPPVNIPQGRFPIGAVARSDARRALVGIIDSGCPFASPMLRDARQTGTRVLGLWDQDDAPAFADRGFRPEGFGYGRAVTREGLNRYLSDSRRPGGTIDEEHCYRLAGYRQARLRMGHGAAVISQLLGKALYGGALQATPGEPPPWDANGPFPLPIDGADLVFVDVPRAGLQDSTSAALARYVIDGLRFILAHAVPGQHVVVNISTGTSRTSHDGKSLFERALRNAVSDARRTGIRLDIVLPSGNGNMEQRYAVLSDARSHLTLFLPPGCEMPQYVTVRWPDGTAGVHLRITPPGGPTQVVRQGQAMGLVGAQGICGGVVSPPPENGQAARSLLAFTPTASNDPLAALAPSGRWRIELDFDQHRKIDGPVRFWFSRNQRNPGALQRGRQADFVDWDRSHHPLAWLRYSEEDPSSPVPNGIRRLGGVTGLATAATGTKPRIHVVGSTFVLGPPDRPSPYSAAAADGSDMPRWSAPGDVSRALRGLTVRGNHGREVLRMVGTSFSAPLVARALVNGTLPYRSRSQPSPRVGSGRLIVY